MSYAVYKFLHIIGIAAIVMALGGAIVGTQVAGEKPASTRKLIALTHGIGMVLVLLGGFGMLAKLGIHGFPWWVAAKSLLWLLLGIWLSVSYRSRASCAYKFAGLLLVVALATGLVLAK